MRFCRTLKTEHRKLRECGHSQSWNLSPVHDWNTTTINGAVQSRTHGPAHELLTMSGAQVTNSPRTLTYDTKGNMTTDDRGCGMTWDFDNMLQSFAANGVTDLKDATYEYDAVGRKTARTTSLYANESSRVLLIPAAHRIIAEYNSDSATTCAYLSVFGDFIDDDFLTIQGDPSSRNYHYAITDIRYSKVAVTSAAASAIRQVAYLPTGSSTIAINGTQGDQFTGRTSDKSSLLLDFCSRQYSTRVGRFLPRDWFAYINGPNNYASYMQLLYTDPFGTDVELFMPATPQKCADVMYYITMASELSRWGTYNKVLWDRFTSGVGGHLTLPWDAFDGGCETSLWLDASTQGGFIVDRMDKAADSLECGQTKTISGSVSKGCKTLRTPMINSYRAKLVWDIEITKTCLFGCCTGYDWKSNYAYSAWDKTDFNLGDAFVVPDPFGFQWVYISDDLVNACGMGKEFTISASKIVNDSGSSWHCR